MSLKARFIALTALGLLVLVAFSGVLPAAHAQSSPSVAVSLSDASVEQGTAITATMSFSNLASDSDTSTTDYTFRADVVDADPCEGGGMGKDRYFYQVDQDPEVRTGTISASCPAGDYTIRATISTPQSVDLASATASFTVAAPAQEPTASPTASIALSPSDAVGEGAEITVTMSFGGLASDSDASTTDYVFRADVVDADDCEGGGIGFDRYMYRVDQDPETRTGTVSADCPAGAYTLRVSISSSDNTELAEATAGFFILGAPVLIEPPTLTALSVSHGNPAVDVTLSPAFESGTLAYSAAVRVAQVTIVPTASDADATVAYLDGNGDAIADADAGADGHQVDLEAGSNTVRVAVGKDSLTTTYTVNLFRLVTQQQTQAQSAVYSRFLGGQNDIIVRWSDPDGCTSKYHIWARIGHSNNQWVVVAPNLATDVTSKTQTLGILLWAVLTDGARIAVHCNATAGGVTRNPPGRKLGEVAIYRTPHAGNSPVAPGNVSLTPGDGQLAVSWDAPANPSSQPIRNTIVQYRVQWKSGSQDWDSDNRQAVKELPPTLSHTITGLTNATEYEVRVRAISSVHDGAWSSAAAQSPGAPPSDDAKLSALALSPGILSPGFVPETTTGYRASVGNSVETTTVTVETNDDGATFVITPEDADSVAAGHQVDLEVGDTEITVEVTAADGVATETYMVTVERLAPDATLSGLRLSHGTLRPKFDSDDTEYRAAVEHSVTQVTVSPTVNAASATVEYQDDLGTALTDADLGASGWQMDLDVGTTQVNLLVRDGTATQTYTLEMERDSDQLGGWTPTRDIDAPAATTNGGARGMWSDATTLWLADSVGDSVFAYALSGGARQDGSGATTDREFSLHSANGDPAGIWSDTTTMWVADSGDDKLYAYTLATGARDEDSEFNLHGDNDNPVGIWSDGTTMWVTDGGDNKLYAYALSGGARQDGSGATTDREFNLHGDNSNPAGIWSNDTTMWVMDSADGMLYAYTLASGARDPQGEFTLRSGQLVGWGIWSDGTTMWVADPAGQNKIYSYILPVAREVTLVSNFGNLSGAVGGDIRQNEWAQSFTTGRNPAGYNLNGVELAFQSGSAEFTATDFVVTIWSATDADPPAPDSRAHTLSTPDYAAGQTEYVFSASGVTLLPLTTYFVHISNGSGDPRPLRIRNNGEDAGGEAGWSIGDQRHFRGRGTTNVWESNANLLRIRIHGSARRGTAPPPTLSADATLSGLTLSEGRLTPAFPGGTTDYTASVGYTVSRITVTPTTTDGGATVAFLDSGDAALADADGNANGHQVDLAVGENAVKVKVTAADGVTTETYTVTVTRTAEDTLLNPPLSDPAAAVKSSAVYSATFRGAWTTDVTPGGIPANAHFTQLVGGVHNADATFLSGGGTATGGVESVAEDGNPNSFKNEINAAGANRLSVLESETGGGNDYTATGSFAVNNFTLSTDHPRVTLITMIAPSPDWFVGVAGLSLLDADGNWVQSLTVNLYPWDAGTEDGTGFAMVNAATSPQGTITSIRGTGEFSTEPIATLTFARQSVNAAPVFPATETGARSVAENSPAGASVGDPVAATDTDTLVYSLGGDDFSLFSLDSGTGQISVAAGTDLDYETKTTYSVTVTAADTAGQTAEIDVTISVSDVAEPPGKPDAPSVSAKPGSSTELDVNWSAPANTGPPIDDYNVRYRVAGETIFSAATFDGTGTSTTIEGLTADTEYEVQVLAHNDEGYGAWSDSGTGSTNAPALAGVVTLTLDPTTVAEDAGTAVTVTATLSGAHATQFTVTVTAAAVSPAADSAYTLSANRTLTFTANATESAGTVTITPVNNTVNEPKNKVITVSGTVAAGVTGVTGPADVELTITDDDHPVVTYTLTLHENDASKTPLDLTNVPENLGQVCIRVTATTEAALPPEIDDSPTVSSMEGTARTHKDYSVVSHLFPLPVSAYSLQGGKYVAVADNCAALQIVDDAVDEANEQFGLFMQGTPNTPGPYLFPNGRDNPLMVTITDDDLPTLTALSVSHGDPAVAVTLVPGFDSGRLEYDADVAYGVVQVTVAADAAAGVEVSFVQADGSTAQADADAGVDGHQVALSPGDNVIKVKATRGDESQTYTVTVTRARATVTIAADAAEADEGVALSFTVSRNPVAGDELEVKLDVSETGTFVPPGNEGMKTVTIPANTASAKHTVRIVVGDEVWDAHSTVTAALVAETDSPYTLGAANSASTEVKDNDFPTATAELTVDPNPVTEGGTVTVTVTVTTNSDQMPHEDGGTITLSTTAGTAQAADYGALSETTFTLAQGDFSAVTVGGNSRYRAVYTATVSTVDDAIQEGDEAFSVTMARGGDLDNRVTLGAPTSRTVTISANDAPVSSAATLSGLSLSGVTFKRTFASDVETYTASVPYTVTSTKVTATPTVDTATVVIKRNGFVASDGTVYLLAGHDTVITVEVTAGNTTNTYTVTVARAQVTLSGTALISNIGQDSSVATFLGGNEWFQSFTTGANAGGYNLSSVELVIAGLPAQTLTSSDLTVAIWSATDAATPLPGSPLHTLDTPAADTIGIASFSASSVTLDPATTYFVRLTSPSGRSVFVDRTTSTAEDSGGAQGWSIGNVRYYRSGGSNADFETSNNMLRIAVKGSRGDPELNVADASATEGSAVTFTVTLSQASAREVTVQYATSIESTDTAEAADFTAVPATTLTIPAKETTKTFTVQTTPDTIDEEDETFTVTLSNPENATISDGTAIGTITSKPTLVTATVADDVLTLTYNKELDPTSTPTVSAFEVAVTKWSGGSPQSRGVSGVEVSGRTVTLTLASAALFGDTVTVTYTVPEANPVRGLNGIEADPLVAHAVQNDTKRAKVSITGVFTGSNIENNLVIAPVVAVLVVFDKPVTGFEAGDLTVTNGTATRVWLCSEDPPVQRYCVNIDVTGANSDVLTVSVPEDVVEERNEPSSQFSDTCCQQVAAEIRFNEIETVVSSLSEGPVNRWFYVHVVFARNVADLYDPLGSEETVPTNAFQSNEVEVTNGTHEMPERPEIIEGGKEQFRVKVTPKAQFEGVLTVSVPAAVAWTGDGGVNGASNLFEIEVDTLAPDVTGIEITSDPGEDETYAVGDEIEATVTFREDVTVESGSPSLGLMVGGSARAAAYSEGSGTDQLVFVYEVTEGDSDDDGVSVEAGRLAGGVVEDAGGNRPPAHGAGGPFATHAVDGVRPKLSAREVVDARLTLTYDEELDGSSTPAPGAFTVNVGDGVRAVTAVAVSDSVVTLTLASAVSAIEAVTVTYTPGADPIQDLVGNDAAALVDETVQDDLLTLTALSVSHGDPAVAATLVPGFDSGVLEYDADVAYGVVQVTVAADAAAGVEVSFVQADGSTALADADAGADGHQVSLSPGDNVIKVKVAQGDESRTYTVTVARAKATVIISADAATADEGDALSFTVTRSPVAADELEVKLDVGETGTFVPPGNEGMKTVTIPADMASAKHTVRIVAGDGVWDAHSTVTVALVVETDSPYTLGALTSAQTRVLDDDFPRVTAVLAVDPNPVAEGGTVTVTVTVTTNSDQEPHADGGTITLGTTAGTAQAADYGALSETTFTLAQGDFSAVTVGGNTRYRATYTATVGIVDDATEEGDETFSVSMARGGDLDNRVTLGTPTSRSITISANDAASNAAPVFPSGTITRSVAENTASGQNVGSPVEATDTDTGDTLTYSLEGTDSGSFSIVSGGQIQTSAALDYEAKSSYSVTVKVNDGTANVTKAVTISVTDVAEPPDQPAAPTVTAKGGTTDSLDVSWTAPANTGRPAIDDYNVQYRIGTTGSFTSHSFTGTGRSTTIAGLTADTEYEVQVQAHNDEGDSPWSASGTGSTAAADSMVTLNLDPTTIDEDSGTAVTVTATVSPARTTQFTVTVTAEAVFPATDAAYTLSANTTLTFTANATESTGTVTITPVNNTDNERDKVITVSGTVAAGVTGVTGPADVTLTIEDDDHPVVTHTLTLHENDAAKTLLDPNNVPEDVGQVCIRVTATTEADLPPEQDGNLYVLTKGLTAAANYPPIDYTGVGSGFEFPLAIADYTLQSGRYVAVNEQCTLVAIVDDSLDEDNEDFEVYMRTDPNTPSPSVYVFEQNSVDRVVVTIIDNDDAPALSIADADGAEGEDLEFTVTLDAASEKPVTVDWAVNDGTATAGDDYTAGSGTLTFALYQTTKTISVATLQDTDPEDDETFTVTLSNARNATIADAEATGTIAASDGFTKSFEEPVCPAQWVTESQYEENPTGCPRLTLLDFGTVRVEWNAVPDATTHSVRYYMDVDGVAKWYTNADPYPGVVHSKVSLNVHTASNLPREANVVYFSFSTQTRDTLPTPWSPYSLISINDPLELEGAAPAPDDVLDPPTGSNLPGKPVLSADPSSANGGRAALSWTGSSNSPTGYDVLVEYSSGEGVNRIIITLESATTNYTYATLREGARRTFRVRGVNANSAGHWSEPTVFVADREDASYPRMPKGFTAYARPNGQVKMSWHDPDAGDGVTGYRIVRVAGWDEMMDHRGFPVDGVTVVTTSRNSVATTYTESGLTANTEYRYAVQWIKAGATAADDVYSALSFIYRVKTKP